MDLLATLPVETQIVIKWLFKFNKTKTAGQRLQSSTGFNTRQPKNGLLILEISTLYYSKEGRKNQSAFFFIPFFRCLGKGAIYGIRQSEKTPENLDEEKGGVIRPRFHQIPGR